jgi:hypothetical protein
MSFFWEEEKENHWITLPKTEVEQLGPTLMKSLTNVPNLSVLCLNHAELGKVETDHDEIY